MAGKCDLRLMLMPNRFFSWLTAIVTEAAEVKPEMTGEETKSTRNPGIKLKQNLNESPKHVHYENYLEPQVLPLNQIESES